MFCEFHRGNHIAAFFSGRPRGDRSLFWDPCPRSPLSAARRWPWQIAGARARVGATKLLQTATNSEKANAWLPPCGLPSKATRMRTGGIARAREHMRAHV